MILVSLYAAIQLVKYILYVKPATSIPCYEITAPEGHSMIIQDPGYIIDQIGYYVGQGSKRGLCNIDVSLDLRYTSTASIYRAIHIIESNGAIVSEKDSTNPLQLILNIQIQ
jgi:hypothetical protein